VPVCLLSSPSTSTKETESTLEEDTILETRQPSEFVNDGPMAWMNPYLDLFGVKEGKSIAFGPIPIDIDESKRPSPAIAAELRKEAAKIFQNIGMDERERRAKAGDIFAIATVAFTVWAALFADNGQLAGHVLRFLSVIPLFLTVGYKLSAETGL
jgi:hypothetical protein